MNKLDTIKNIYEVNQLLNIYNYELTDSHNPSVKVNIKIIMTDEEKCEVSKKCWQLKMKALDKNVIIN